MKPEIQDKPKSETGGRWQKGQSGNPHGRPTNAEIDLFRKALVEGEKKYGKDIFTHAVQRAFVNDTVLIALLKKIIPDKIAGEGFGDTINIINSFKRFIETVNAENATGRTDTI